MSGNFQMTNAGRFISRGYGRHPTRTIDSWELIYVLSGELELFEEKEDFSLRTGDRLLLRPGRLHGGRSAYPAGLSFFWVHLLPKDEEARFRLDRMTSCGRTARPERFAAYCMMLLAEQRDGVSRTADLLVELLLNEAELPLSGNPPPERLAARAMEEITLHFEESISTSSLAEMLGCHPDYLGRVFRRNFRCTVVEAINRERIRHSCRLLENPLLPVKEAGFESGFNDDAYFRRCFRREMGCSPREYRRLRCGEHRNTE